MDSGHFTRIQSVERSCRLLEALKELEGATLTELATATGISKSSVYNHLQTLATEGYVTQHGNEYRGGLKWLNLAGHARDRHPLYQVGRAATASLAEETGQVAALTTENGGKSVYLYQQRGQHAVEYGSHLGTRLHMHATAAGKAMLAAMTEQRRDAIIDRHGLPELTAQTITDRGTLDDELARTRERGYAIDDEERIAGMRGIGAAITDESEGGLLGAVAIGGSTIAIRDENFEHTFPELVTTHARTIEISASYS